MLRGCNNFPEYCAWGLTNKQINKMTQTQFDKLLNDGNVVLLGTWWSGRIETISMRDKTAGANGARRTAYVLRQTVMTEKDPIPVSRWLKDGEDPEKILMPAKRGDKVVVVVSSMETSNGQMNIGGVVEPLK